METTVAQQAAFQTKTTRMVLTSLAMAYVFVLSIAGLLVIHFTGAMATNSTGNMLVLALYLFGLLVSTTELAVAWVKLGKLRDCISS